MVITGSARKPSEIKKTGTGSDRFLRFLVYSGPGIGKTSLAGTSPKCLIMDADRSTEVLATRGLVADKWEVNDWDDINKCVNWCRDEGYKQYDWLWLDGIHGFQERGLDDIMTQLVAKRSHRRMWLPDKGEYGQNMNRLKLLLRGMRDLPMNIGATTHITRVEDEDGEVQYMPLVQGKDMIPTTCTYFGLIGRLESYQNKETKAEGVKFTTRKLGGKFYSKDRFNVGVILNPTIPKIVARIEEARANGGRRPSSGSKPTTQKETGTK